MRREFFVDVDHAVANVLWVSRLNEIVVPAELLVGLHARQELGAGPEVGDAGNCDC